MTRAGQQVTTPCGSRGVLTGELKGLTGLRIVAAAWVVLFHFHFTPLPGVAESWDVSDDKKTYTIHLRKNARWSYGEPVTAREVTRWWAVSISGARKRSVPGPPTPASRRRRTTAPVAGLGSSGAVLHMDEPRCLACGVRFRVEFLDA